LTLPATSNTLAARYKTLPGFTIVHVPRNFGEYLTVKQAAGFLGVCVKTLHNWDRAGKLRPARHPLNGYRLYRRQDLQAILRRVQPSDAKGSHHAR
jgi:hypothetical protein